MRQNTIERMALAWGIGWAVAMVGIVAGTLLGLTTRSAPVVQMLIGAVGIAIGAYLSAVVVDDPLDDLGWISSRVCRILGWTAAFVLASLLFWNWGPLEDRGLVPPARVTVDHSTHGSVRNADGSTTTWQSGSSGDAWWGPMPMVACPAVFGLFGGLVAGLTNRRRWTLFQIVKAFVVASAWAGACVLAWRLACIGCYLLGGLLAGAFGRVFHPLGIPGLFLGCAIAGLLTGALASVLATPFELFAAEPSVLPTRT